MIRILIITMAKKKLIFLRVAMAPRPRSRFHQGNRTSLAFHAGNEKPVQPLEGLGNQRSGELRRRHVVPRNTPEDGCHLTPAVYPVVSFQWLLQSNSFSFYPPSKFWGGP